MVVLQCKVRQKGQNNCVFVLRCWLKQTCRNTCFVLQCWMRHKSRNKCVCVVALDKAKRSKQLCLCCGVGEVKPVKISSRLCVSVLGEAEKVIQVVDVVQMTHTDDPTVTYPPPPATPTPPQPRPQSQPNTYNSVQKTVRPSDRLAHLPDEQRLLNYVMRGYEKSVRPVRVATTPVVIRMGLTLTQIFDMVSQIYCITGFAAGYSNLLCYWFAGGSSDLLYYWFAGGPSDLLYYWFAGGSSDLLYYWFAGGSSDFTVLLVCWWF